MSNQNNPAENQPALTGGQSDNPIASVTTPSAQAIQSVQAIQQVRTGQSGQSGQSAKEVQDVQLSPTMPSARRAIILLLIALGCSTAFVSFIIRGGLGLGLSLTILIAEVALWFYSAQHIDRPKNLTVLVRTSSGRRLLLLFYLTAVILFLGATYTVYSNTALHFLNYLVIIALLIVQSLLFGIGNKQAGPGNIGIMQTRTGNTQNEQAGPIQALNPHYSSIPADQIESMNDLRDWDDPLFWLECVFSPFIRPFASLKRLPKTISLARHWQQNHHSPGESGESDQSGATGEAGHTRSASQTRDANEATDGYRADHASSASRRKHASHGGHLIGQILLGLVLALPILLIAGSILTSADAVFSDKMSQFLSFWRTMPLRDRLADLALICLFFPFIFSYLESCRTRWYLFIHQAPGGATNTGTGPAASANLHPTPGPAGSAILNPTPGPAGSAILNPTPGQASGTDQVYYNTTAMNAAMKARQTWPIHLKPVTMITILTSVNLLYLAFASVQIAYLTGSFQFVLPESLTYAEYARQGFFELATMAPINILLMLFAIKGSVRLGLAGKILRSQSLILVAGSFIQWFSAIFRMQMYVQTYGLTLLRFFVTAFMLLMAAIFIMMIIKEFRPIFPLFKTAAVATALSLLILNTVNADAIIARHNLNHYLSGVGSTFDVQYYRDLSPDVLPILIEALPELDLASRQAVQTLLSDRYEDLQHQTAGQNWLGYNQSINDAVKALETAGIQ